MHIERSTEKIGFMLTKRAAQKDSGYYLRAAGMLNLTMASMAAVDCTISQETFTTGPTEIQKSHDRLHALQAR